MRYAKIPNKAQNFFFSIQGYERLKKGPGTEFIYTHECVDKITEVSPKSAQKLADQPIIVLKKSQKSRQIEFD